MSLRNQASNWLERLPAGSISTWEDLTTHFLAEFFSPGRTAKLRNDIMMFQQHQGESLSEAWTRFKDLLQEFPHHGIDLWLQANPKLNVNSTSLVLSAHSYPADDPQCSTQIHVSINTITICLKWPGKSQTNKPEKEEQDEKDNPENINTNPSLPPDPSVSFIIKKVCKLKSFIESLGLVPQSSDIEFVCTKGDDGDMMFIVIINKNDDSHKEEPEVGEKAGVGELEVEYFDVSPTRSELAYHKLYLTRRILEDLRMFSLTLGGRLNQLSHVSSPLLSKPWEYYQLERRQRLPSFKEFHLESKRDHTLLTFTMAGVDVNTLTMEQYLALSRENQALGMVKPKIGGNVNFKIKSQFMCKLKEDTFSGNKDKDAHDHIDRVISIVGLFNIPGVTKDAVML
ncbi:zinc finger, CCHC-type containing protein [Tanacetum coccineum]